MSVGGGSNCGGHPYISFLFRMNFFISCRVHSDRPWPASTYVPTDKIIKDGQA